MSLDTPGKIRAFYLEKWSQFGATPRGMAWADDETHYTRISRALQLANVTGASLNRVLDVGCGIGLLPLLWGFGQSYNPSDRRQGTYHGIDLVEAYVDRAREMFSKNPNLVFWHGDYLGWSGELYTVTAAIGTLAWLDQQTALSILTKMWKETAAGGAMVFTYLPDNPLPNMVIKWISKEFQVDQMVTYTGYSNGAPEVMVVFKKKNKFEWRETSEIPEVVYDPYKHREELEQEIANGEYRDDEDRD